MRRRIVANGLLLGLLFVVCGCASFTAEEAEIHDEIFSYEIPFDKAFLRIVDTINDTPDWTLDGTNQRDGLIIVRGNDFDSEQVTIILKRIEKRHVTVELAKESQRSRNVGTLLKAIDTDLINLT
ncbi:MAG: hypothetical protein JW938_07835 [Candidatus Omnitrophica bacterium]|nr:hypothetical protein [Candidatus Omnitrophota bacterium]